MVAGDLTPGGNATSDTIMPESQINGLSQSPVPSLSERELYEGPFVVIKVKDLLGITVGGGVHQFTYAPMVTLKEFIIDVAAKFQSTVEEIELIYQCGGGLLEICKMPGDWTLEGASMPADREKIYSVSIQKNKPKKKSLTRNYDESINDLVDGKDNSGNYTSTTITLPGPCSSINLNGPREFVGLKNMTMTCYLNSVLQSLWFTPELRNALYRFNGEHILKSQQKSVVHMLKRLFLLLQLSVRESVGTEELTQSFGWRAEESWTQHDIEEMFRVLSDALSKELKGTEMEGLFSALFGVLFADFINCQKCGGSREREDFQLGLALPIRNFGKPLNTPCLEEAIQAFVSTELLNENNKVNCDACNERTDSVKGLRFKKLPYLLMLHLKRYEYDFERQTRAKINDKIEFPIILNMNQFLTTSPTETANTEKPAITPLDCSIPNLNPEWFVTPDHGKRRMEHSRKAVLIGDCTLKAPLSDGENVSAATTEDEKVQVLDTGYEIPAEARNYIEKFGPHVYQLYSVLTHRGNLTGGHYYAFIFDFESNVWYRCDDTKVMRVPVQDLKATYGGDASVSRQGLYEVGTAYMLLYRKIDEKINSLPLLFPDIPECTQIMWRKMIEEDKEAQKRDEVGRTVVLLQVKYRENGIADTKTSDVILPRSLSMKDAAMSCYKELFPDAAQPNADHIRIVKFDHEAKIIEYSWKDESLSLDLAFPVSKCDESKPNSVLLEIRTSTEIEWETYKASDTVCLVYHANCESQTLGRIVMEVHVTEYDTVKTLKQKVLSKFGLTDPDVQLFCVFGRHTLTQLSDDFQLIGHYHFGRVNDVFFEAVNDQDAELLAKFLKSYVGSLCFEVHVPNARPENVNSLESAGTDKTISPEGNSNSDPGKQIADGDSNSQEAVSIPESNQTAISNAKTERSELTKGPKSFYFQILSESVLPDEQWKVYSVRAERRMTLDYLSVRIQGLINVPEKDFIIYTIKEDKEVELLEYSEKISHLQPLGTIRVRYGSRMSENEARISVFTLTPENAETPSSLLKEFVFNKSQTVDEVKKIIAESCKSVTGVTNPDCYRVRRKVGGNPGKIMKDDMIFFDYCKRHGADAYVQIFEAPEKWSTSNYGFFTRLWSPDVFTVGKLQEIVVYHDYTKDTEELIAEAVSSQYSIPLEFLRLAKITCDYPFKVTPYAAHETLAWFQIPREPTKLSLLSDDLCLCVTDSRVATKALTPEELEEYRNEYIRETAEADEVTVETRPLRREIGLRINTEI